MARVELRGDWRKMRHAFDRMTELGREMADRMMSEVANDVRDELHKTVNSSPPPRNTESTERRKAHDTPLLETGGMQSDDSVVVEKEDSGDRAVYIVKGNPNKTHSRTGTSYEDILGIMEKGSVDIPARHIFSITYDRKKREIEAYAIKQAQDFMKG